MNCPKCPTGVVVKNTACGKEFYVCRKCKQEVFETVASPAPVASTPGCVGGSFTLSQQAAQDYQHNMQGGMSQGGQLGGIQGGLSQQGGAGAMGGQVSGGLAGQGFGWIPRQ